MNLGHYFSLTFSFHTLFLFYYSQLYIFSKSVNTMHNLFFFSQYFSTKCFTHNNSFIINFSGIKPNLFLKTCLSSQSFFNNIFFDLYYLSSFVFLCSLQNYVCITFALNTTLLTFSHLLSSYVYIFHHFPHFSWYSI